MNLKDFFIWTLVGEANYSSTRKALDQYIPIFQEKNMHYIPKYSYCDHKEEIIKKTENHIEMTSQFITNKEPQHFLEIDEVFSSTSQYFLNKNAFLSTIQMLGSSDQVKRWEDLVINGRIIGKNK